MPLPKRYKPNIFEPTLQARWESVGAYHFERGSDSPIYAIDTPPPTVSGNLHLGHVFSYSHADFIARFWRMNGFNVFYPMGFDDNGLPTERLVEREQGINPRDIGRQAFIKLCLETSIQAEQEYRTLWKRLGLSIDWRYTYRTIDEQSHRIAQLSFLKLHAKGLVYQREAPSLWCPQCQTAIAQADLEDRDRQSEFITLTFSWINTDSHHVSLPVATTRPELLPACVALFVHPSDDRYKKIIGGTARVPVFNQEVPILADPEADPDIGTGIVMCCTFGDSTDVAWWHKHNLPLVQTIDTQGNMTSEAGELSGYTLVEARKRIKGILEFNGLLVDRHNTNQTVRIHDRCKTPVEYIVTRQWFVRVLDYKDDLLALGDELNWHPEHMASRFRDWVENISWDWCISRQRFHGVPFPVWYCQECSEPIIADPDQLPVDPVEISPKSSCPVCGGTAFYPELDVLDTWATSSLTPQIVGRWQSDPDLYQQIYPLTLRPQAHEIIRTWLFYTLVMSHYHFNTIPFKDVLISGWGIAGEGMGKISKSHGGGPIPPMDMLNQYSADSLRYWAASGGPGKDLVISEEKIMIGSKLVTKIWNVARFCSQFNTYTQPVSEIKEDFTPADRWLLNRIQRLIQQVTDLFREYEYAAAKNEIEMFFWLFADNYIEMAKQRLYDDSNPQHEASVFAIHHALQIFIKLFAPIMPHVTEEIYQGILSSDPNYSGIDHDFQSIHNSSWPTPDTQLIDDSAEEAGEILLSIATAVRRYKSERKLSLGTEINRLQLATDKPTIANTLREAMPDLASVARAKEIDILSSRELSSLPFSLETDYSIHIEP